VLAARVGSLDACDFLTMDFDVHQSELRHAIDLARDLRWLLDQIGLTGYPKTSGQSGLHVFVPMGPGVTFETARALADLLGRILEGRHSASATMERVVEKRGPRVYIDTGQTGRSRTIVAPWSVRAYPGATVSTPLSWDEVSLALDPTRFTMFSAPERARESGDPMADMLTRRPDVPAAIQALGKLLGNP
jgi:bifunctional non-homologous end joining protein LigD